MFNEHHPYITLPTSRSVGLITISSTDSDFFNSPQNVSGLLLLFIGAIYFFLGMCLVQVVEFSRIEYLKARSKYQELDPDDTEASV